MTIKHNTPVMLTCQAVLPVTSSKTPNVPSWYPGDEVKPAPMPLLVVQGFVNTQDLEQGTDLLDDPATARRWLVAAGLLDRDSELARADLGRARAVREALRSMLLSNGGYTIGADELAPLRALAGARRPLLQVGDDGKLSLERSQGPTLQDALFELLLIVRAAQEEGSWARLKVCANPECGWAYYDRSRNQQGSWCDMAVCGNRLKNRQLRARRS
jgi:predicted RNA-binding Zn ribbon-like protein